MRLPLYKCLSSSVLFDSAYICIERSCLPVSSVLCDSAKSNQSWSLQIPINHGVYKGLGVCWLKVYVPLGHERQKKVKARASVSVQCWLTGVVCFDVCTLTADV